MTTSPDPTPLSLSDCADVLAYVPHALGFHPGDSLVLLLLSGQGIDATLRVDLPRQLEAQLLAAWCAQVAELATRLPRTSSVLAMLYAPPAGELAGTSAQRVFLDQVEAAIAERGVSMDKAWAVDHEQIHDYSPDAVQAHQPRPDTDLNETNLRLIMAGSAPLDSPWDGTGMPRWANASEVQQQLAELEPDLLDCLDAWA